MKMLAAKSTADLNEHLVELLEAAAAHSTTVNFEQLLNRWLRAETHCAGSALLLFITDSRRAECSVCGDKALESPIDCGEVVAFTSMFAYSDEVPSTSESIPESMRASLSLLVDLVTDSMTADKQKDAPARKLSTLDNLVYTLLPIHAKSGLIAALCLFHKATSSAIDEVRWLKPRLRLIASLLGIVLNIEQQKRLAHQSRVFLNMAQNVFSSLDDMSQLVRNITKEAKTLVQAETCSLFLLDKEHGELVAEVFEKNGLTNDYLSEVRVPLTHGIAGHVATTGELMNVKDAYSNPLFYREVDENTGFFTRNMLCLPIKDAKGDLIGVVELCNKMGRSNFTEHDEHIATAFSVYCAISISHCLLYRKLQEAQRRHDVASDLMSVTNTSMQIAEEDVMRLTMNEIHRPTEFDNDFDTLLFLPRLVASPDQQFEACLSMYNEMGFLSRHRINQRTLARFVLTVKQGYRDVPYHNFCHAFAVTHYMYMLLRQPQTHDYFSELERVSLLTASLCHDIDHRGTTNAFQVQSKTPLAQLYSSEGSVLERHHFAQTVCILNKTDCNIFAYLNRSDYQVALDYIREIILATDIATHFRRRHKIQAMLEGGFDKNNREHRRLLMCVMMNTSDISDQSKDWPASKRIAASIYTEFFSQGDLEKAMGATPGEMMDRERASIPKLQIDFFDSLALPLFDALSTLLPDTRASYNSLQRNRQCWQVMAKVVAQDDPATSQLDIMNDKQLEERVIHQTATIPTLLREHKDVIVQAPTGSGKTIAYLLPICEQLMRLKCTGKQQIGAIVIVPNRELAHQVHSVAKPLAAVCNLSLACFTGGVAIEKDLKIFSTSGGNVIIGTPGRLDELFSTTTGPKWSKLLRSLEMLIVDEADRLAEMGFQTQLANILTRLPKQRRTGLFSATQCQPIEELLKFGMRDPQRITISADSSAPSTSASVTPLTLSNYYFPVEADSKFVTLLGFLKLHKSSKVLVFCSSCACADYLYSLIEVVWPKHPTLLVLHSKKKAKREKIFHRFRTQQSCVLLCTDVMARGIDVTDIDWVVQVDPPKKSSWFVHRAGRAARGERFGSSLLLLLPTEHGYIDYLHKHEHTTLMHYDAPLQPAMEPKVMRTKILEAVKKDRSLLLKGTQAFVSYIQSYAKHDCHVVCSLKELDVIGVAHDYGLLRLPKMPELCNRDLSTFDRVDLNTSEIPFKNAQQEEKRQAAVLERRRQAEQKRKVRSDRMARQAAGAKINKRKRTHNPTDWEDIDDDYKLMKKLKKGKINKQQFDEQFLAC